MMKRNPFEANNQKAAGELFEEVNEMDLKQLNGGSGWFSRQIARPQTIGHGYICTHSAECMGTRRCG